MLRGTRGSRSLNDLTAIEESDAAAGLLQPARSLRTSWSFANLLPDPAEEAEQSRTEEAAQRQGEGHGEGHGDADAQQDQQRQRQRQRRRRQRQEQAGKGKERSLLGKFQVRLAEQVCDMLRQAAACKDGAGSSKVLEELFFNISSTVPERAAARLDLDEQRRWFYYELLATYYYKLECRQPGSVAETLLPLCAPLWSLEHLPALFALLLHRWLVETEAGRSGKSWLMRFNVFLKGTYQLFWFDVQHETRKVWPLFIRLRDHMFSAESSFFNATSPRGASMLDLGFADGGLPTQGSEVAPGPYQEYGLRTARESIRKDFACVLCRFFYYYTSRPERVGHFCINQLQLEEGLDTFVPQLVRQLRALRSEAVIRRYLRCAASIPVDSLGLSSKNQLHAVLNELHLPGAPLHPSPATMRAAEATMNTLFPQGRWTRFAINFCFKLLRPLYLPRSIIAFLAKLFRRDSARARSKST